MNLHDLKPPEGSRREKVRRGRGEAARRGEKSGRGTKGQKKRNTVHPYFEGGQTPIYRRFPKRGFNPRQRTEYEEVNVRSLNRFEDGTTVGVDELYEAGLIDQRENVKLLGDGTLDVSLTVRVHRASKGGREKVEQAGGQVEIVSLHPESE